MEILGELSHSTIWLIIAIIFAVLEAITLGITSIWFVFGALASMLASMLGGPVYIQVIVFILVSVILLIFTRPILVEKFRLGKEKTNIDAIIDQEAVVKEKIVNVEGKGQVVINGVVWSARSIDGEDIDEGEEVEVKEIEGVKAIVSKVIKK